MSETYLGLTGDDLIRAVANDLMLTLKNLERNTMADFDQLLTEVESQGAMLVELMKVTSAVHDHMTAASSGAVIADSTQKQIDAVMAAAMKNHEALTTALKNMQDAAALTGTPVAPAS